MCVGRCQGNIVDNHRFKEMYLEFCGVVAGILRGCCTKNVQFRGRRIFLVFNYCSLCSEHLFGMKLMVLEPPKLIFSTWPLGLTVDPVVRGSRVIHTLATSPQHPRNLPAGISKALQNIPATYPQAFCSMLFRYPQKNKTMKK